MGTEKAYTEAQLKQKIARMRKLSGLMPSFFQSGKARFGAERYLDTAAGRVRVLTYRMEEDAVLPLFVNIHGSGFVFGNAEMDDPFMPNLASWANVKIISVDYRLAPEHPFPTAIEECYAVAEYAKTHPGEFGIDPDRIAVGGHSAGGNFSAAVQLMDAERNQLNLRCLILDYPPLDVYTDAASKPKGTIPVHFSRMFDACYCVDREARKNPLISPVYASREQLSAFPPTLVITASRDSLCGEGEQFRDMLRDAGVEVTHKRFEAEHGFNLREGAVSEESWRLMAAYLKEHL